MAKKTKLNRIHVLPDKRFGFLKWAVKFVNWELRYEYINTGGVWCNDVDGNEIIGVYGKFRTKALAVADAIEQAKSHQPSSLRCHGRDGKIQWERSYGKGSESPRKG